MSNFLEDIERLTETNIGGVSSIEICDSRNCPEFKIIQNEVSQNIRPDESHWTKIYAVRDSIDFVATTKMKNGIELYDQKVSLVIPKHRLEIDRNLAKFKRGRFVVLIHGNNGDSILMGSKDAPLKFFLKDIRYKGKVTQKNSYRILFEVLSQVKPCFYTAVGDSLPLITSNRMIWEDGTLAEWEDGTPREFEN